MGKWLRQVANDADAGKLQALAAVIFIEGVPLPITNIMDPGNSNERLRLAGSAGQLAHMLQQTEYNTRMASLAAQPDPA